ncbi:ADP-ribosylation factor-like protein 16 isoform X2 [Erinaceus europaeus]|uniref:ADP-ribosylation factor-like protein 16 isoform X2 n=1 Tax=Erinaceus europaeus TaxID=9365 RepID=A0ABM3VTT3_ERIEU|nr:ADP-ribosylation factor-like protein 16 isoform X2 [Erinaceus europaeus]
MFLLLGPSGVGKTLLVKRLQTILSRVWEWGVRGRGLRFGGWRTKSRVLRGPTAVPVLDCPAQLSSQDGKGDLGEPPPTWPTVGDSLPQLGWSRDALGKRAGLERDPGSRLEGWSGLPALGRVPCKIAPMWFSPQFMVDTSNPTQLSVSCAQLLGLLSAEQLAGASVLILFNKIDLPCYMSTEEMKSLLRLPDIIACATQNISTVEISARKGTGLPGVLRWLQDTHRSHV